MMTLKIDFRKTSGPMINKIDRDFQTYVKNIVTRDDSFSSKKLDFIWERPQCKLKNG